MGIDRKFKSKFNKLLESYYKGEEYLSAPERTNEELETWTPRLNYYAEQLSKMMVEYENITKEKIPDRIVQGGFILYD